MKTKSMRGVCWAIISAAIVASCTGSVTTETVEEARVFVAVENPLEHYTAMLDELKAGISSAVPAVDEQKKAACQKARAAEKAAEADMNAKQDALNKNRGSVGLLNHRKGWIGRATKAMAERKTTLQQAVAMRGGAEKTAALKAAREALTKIQKNYDMAASELKKAQAAVDKAKLEEPALIAALDAAKEVLSQAQARTMQAVIDLGLGAFLSSDALDERLVKYIVLSEATPAGLAEFAKQGAEQGALVEKMLASTELMKQMAVADGANRERGSRKQPPGPAKYGQAMKIYDDIQKASPNAKEGVLQRLALAIGLEHAVPVSQRNPKGRTDAPTTVDPVKRYLHYEKAYLGGELDEGFKGLSVYDYRMVVNGNEPDDTLAWGRKMLRNYRPDHITTDDYRWRYVKAVKTDVKYGSGDNKYDKPELQFFQNILMNGGVCGRRAFFGRFMLRAFGVPTTARPQRGHAALTHWTPDGWVVCLGARWGIGSTKTRYKKDLDFLANTQARENNGRFLQVKRAQWIGDVLGENQTFGFYAGDPAFWYGMSLYLQRDIIEKARAVALAAVGTDIGEANESKVKDAIEAATITEADRKIVTGPDGTITIPAVACSKPTNSTAKIIFMPSNLGGMQLHYGRLGNHEEFEYTFEVPKTGKYALTARVVTPSWKQHLLVSANDEDKLTDIALPFTVGMWDKTQPVEIDLQRGRNLLRFWREGSVKGVTIKDFTLRPVL